MGAVGGWGQSLTVGTAASNLRVEAVSTRFCEPLRVKFPGPTRPRTCWRTASPSTLLATHPIAAPHDTSDVRLVESARAENLNVETVTSNPLLTDRKWAIQFNTGGTVTIILGMKDYGRG